MGYGKSYWPIPSNNNRIKKKKLKKLYEFPEERNLAGFISQSLAPVLRVPVMSSDVISGIFQTKD
jgi:hypothetical protein